MYSNLPFITFLCSDFRNIRNIGKTATLSMLKITFNNLKFSLQKELFNLVLK